MKPWELEEEREKERWIIREGRRDTKKRDPSNKVLGIIKKSKHKIQESDESFKNKKVRVRESDE